MRGKVILHLSCAASKFNNMCSIIDGGMHLFIQYLLLFISKRKRFTSLMTLGISIVYTLIALLKILLFVAVPAIQLIVLVNRFLRMIKLLPMIY